MAVATSGKPAGWLGTTRSFGVFFAAAARQHFANMLTILRLLAVVPLVWAIAIERYDLALQIFVLAALSDALDGWYAKATNTCSKLGALLDPIADKLIVIACLVALAAKLALPYGFGIVLILREGLMGAGYLALRWQGRSDGQVRPSLIGKTATALLLTAIGATLAELAGLLVLGPALWVLSWVTGAVLTLATVRYAMSFWQTWRQPLSPASA